MKQIYAIFLTMLLGLFSLGASADTNVTINVDDASRVVVKVNYVAQDIVSGDNAFTIPQYGSVSIEAQDGNFLTKVTKTNSTVTDSEQYVSNMTSCSVYVSDSDEGAVIKVTSANADEARTASCTVIVDDASAVRLQRGGTYTYPTLVNGSNTVKFVPGTEVPFTIASTNYSTPLYQVTLDGTVLTASGSQYYVTPNDGSVIQVTSAFPDVDCPVHIVLSEGAEGIVTSVSVDGTPVENWNADDFSVKAGKSLSISANNTDYAIESFLVNGTSQYFYGSWQGTITAETTININAHKYGTVKCVLNVDDPANITVYKGYSYMNDILNVVAGENQVELSENNAMMQIKPNSGCFINSILKGEETLSAQYDGSYSLTVADGDIYTVSSGAIVRDKKCNVWVDDVTLASWSCSFARADHSYITLQTGNNEIEFAEADNNFNFAAYGPEITSVYITQNGEVVSPMYEGGNSYEFTLADGDELRIYLAGKPEEKPMLANGDYYIQNKESGLFMAGANSWGTRLTATTQGEVFTANLSEGVYELVNTSLGCTNVQLGTNLFIDATGFNWTIDAAEGEEGVYTISNANGYLVQSDEAGVHTGYLVNQAAEVTEAAKWLILTKEQAVAQLEGASKGAPKNASFLIADANFSRNRNTDVWTAETSNKNLAGGASENNCGESWRATFDIYQTITVPNGVYELTAQAALTDYTDAYDGNEYPVVYANEASAIFNNMEEADRGTSMSQLSASFTAGKYYVEPVKVTVTDGTLRIGVKGTRTDTWCIWDNFNLTYYGEETAEMAQLVGVTPEEGSMVELDTEYSVTFSAPVKYSKYLSDIAVGLNWFGDGDGATFAISEDNKTITAKLDLETLAMYGVTTKEDLISKFGSTVALHVYGVKDLATGEPLEYNDPDGEDQFTFNFMLGKPAIQVEPANGSKVESIETIYIAAAEGIMLNPEAADKKILVMKNKEQIAEITADQLEPAPGIELMDDDDDDFGIGGEESESVMYYSYTFDPAITEAGNYEIYIPEAMFVINGFETDVTIVSYTVGGESVGIAADPAAGEVESLSEITLTYGDGQGISPSYMEDTDLTITDAEGNVLATFTSDDMMENIIQADPDDWFSDIIGIKLVLAEPITAPGAYTLNIPAGAFYVGENWDSNKATSFVYTVTGAAQTGVQNGYYLLKNKRTAKYAVWTGDDTQIGQSADKSMEAIWTVESNGDGTYKLGNYATDKYYVGHSEFAEEGAPVYLLESEWNEGYYVVSLTADASANCWDDQGNTTLVGYWHPSASDNQGTSWEIIAVTPEQVQNSIEMAKLIAEVSEVYEGNTNYIKGDGLITSVDQLSSPYTEPNEGSLEALLDGDASSFWHSAWSSGSVDNGIHYLEIALPEGTQGEILLSYTRRNASNDQLTQAEIIGVNGDETTSIAVLDMPRGSNDETIARNFVLDQAYEAIRILELHTTSDRGYWHAAEIQLYPVVLDAECANAQAPEAAAAVAEAIEAAKAVVENPTAEDIAALQAAYDAYLAATSGAEVVDIAGAWYENGKGQYYGANGWENFELVNNDITIVQTGSTITISGLLGDAQNVLTGTIVGNTITIAKGQTLNYDGYEWMSGAEDADYNMIDLVGTISEDGQTITLPGFNIFYDYDGTIYSYMYDLDIVLSREKAAEDRINGINVDAQGTIYNIAGQRVNKAGKGVYIINGKKYLNK